MNAPLPDDYRELIEAARDALRDLFDGSHPDSWTMTRHGYGEIRRALDRDDQAREYVQWKEERGLTDERHARLARAYKRRDEQWKALRRERREALLLELLGEARMTATDLAECVDDHIGNDEGETVISSQDVRVVLNRMHVNGQLNRESEIYRAKLRWRYSRRHGLDGPIADLERRFREGDGS